MSESFPANEDPLRKESLEQSADNLIESLRVANLMVPQTYGSVRSMGAESILRETSTKHDFSVSELLNEAQRPERGAKEIFYKNMMAAHAGRQIEAKNLATMDEEEKRERAYAVFDYHCDVALTGTAEVMEFFEEKYPDKELVEQQQYALKFMEVVNIALQDTRLREDLVSYADQVAEDRSNRDRCAQELQESWFELFVDHFKAQFDGPIDKEESASFVELFYKVTDPEPRLLELGDDESE
ncbi:MAG: hypothetical protein AAGA35_01390 [Patescibacteria group bacterium]